MDVKDLLQSTGLWMIGFITLVFLFLTYGARPCLRLLGLLFELMGGVGLEGSGL